MTFDENVDRSSFEGAIYRAVCIAAFDLEVEEAIANVDTELVVEACHRSTDRLHSCLRKAKRKKSAERGIRVTKKTFLAVASIFSFICISFVIGIFYVPPIRAEVVKYFIERFPEYSIYTAISTTEIDNTSDLPVLPSYIPEGYELSVDDYFSFAEHMYIWEKEEGRIIFWQNKNASRKFLNTEDADISQETFGNIVVEISNRDDSRIMYFVYNGSAFSLHSDLPISECRKIIESI